MSWNPVAMDVSLSEPQELVMDREAWRAVIHGVARSWTWVSDWTELMSWVSIYKILNDVLLILVIFSFFTMPQWPPTAVLLPGKSHGWRSLVGYSPWGREESDTTERLHFRFSLSCTGEGNGNPLQCSCLENPRDGGAWWAAVSGVAQFGHDWSDLAAAAVWPLILEPNSMSLNPVSTTWFLFILGKLFEQCILYFLCLWTGIIIVPI